MGVLFTGVEGPLNATFCAHVTGNGSCLLRTAFKRGGGGLEKDDRLEPEAFGKRNKELIYEKNVTFHSGMCILSMIVW